VKLTSNRRTWGFGLCFSLTGRLLQGNDREVVFAVSVVRVFGTNGSLN
jgi:hypothetical protein